MMRSFLFSLLALVAGLLWLSPANAAHRSPATPTSAAAPDIRAFALVSPGQGWVLAANDLFWTDDGGATWRKRTPPIAGTILTVDFLDQDNGWVVAIGPGDDVVPDYSLAITGDGGTTWDVQTTDLFSTGDVAGIPAAVHLERLDADTAWLMVKRASGSNFDQGMLFGTSDGGETWEKLAPPSGNPVYFVNDKDGWIAGGPEGTTLFHTQDGGRSWEKQQIIEPGAQESLRYRFLLPSLDDTGYGILPVLVNDADATQLDIYVTWDNGDTWDFSRRIAISDFATDHIPLAILGPESWLSVTPMGRIINSGGQGAGIVESLAAGLSGQIVELSMADRARGWALQTSSACDTDARNGSRRCSRQINLIQTNDGGQTWRALTFPDSGHSTLPEIARGLGAQALEETTILQAHGFDKCEIPTQSQLSHWYQNSPYQAVNLYIGGSCRACANSALTASYVSQLKDQGWTFIPTWVGPQTTCWSGSCSGNIDNDPALAYDQGVSEADAAIARAIELGLAESDGSGAVIYYDLEAYANNSACREAAKSFISGWSARLREVGSQAGVYGSACTSYIPDFNSIPNIPDVVWLAHWIYDAYNEAASVWDVACISNDLWANQQRLRQYTGGHNETWDSVTLNIDSDVLDGVVAGCALAEFNASPTISSDGSSVSLAWEPVSGAVEYTIYRGQAPYFTPAVAYATTAGTNWTDPDANAAGDPALNHYYIVRAANTCGESNILYRIGTFDYSLMPGSLVLTYRQYLTTEAR